MQYILSSSFVSLVSFVNIAFYTVLFIVGSPLLARKWPTSWILHITAIACGVLFNCYVFLQSRRRFDVLTRSLKPLKAYTMAVKKVLDEFRSLVKDFISSQLLKTTSLGVFCQHFGLNGLLTYLRSTNSMNLGAKNKKVVRRDFHTPDLSSNQNIKATKAQSDPVKRPEKFCIKGKYLPAKSPELFKNKIYLTRRNLNKALDH